MNKIQIFKFIIVCLIIYSCKSESTDYKNFHFKQYNMKIKIPIDFKSANENEIKKFYNTGLELGKKNGYEMDSIQNNLLFLNKGEFSSIKIKYTSVSDEVTKDYENQWRKLNRITFDILNKEKIPESKIDTTSRIEMINDINFYVFETNVKLLDLKNNKTNFKILRYSTPLKNLDFVINAGYVNQIDEEKILESIKSIKISKK
jgi:hypothetical protein